MRNKLFFVRSYVSNFSLAAILSVSLFGFHHAFCAEAITDANPMRIPQVGDYGLRIVTSNLLELTLITTKGAHDGTLTNWNFVPFNSATLTPPSTSEFAVTVNGNSATVRSVGFKRRPISAPLNSYDLRIGNYLYLQLATPLSGNEAVTVNNPDSTLWNSSVQFAATNSAMRISPAIHVNQEGYMPNYIKCAEVGFFAGSIGELPLPANLGFNLVNVGNNQVVYSGALTTRSDTGWGYSPAPYAKVLEANFTSYNTPGEYVVQVPTLGISYPFMINAGIGAMFARTYELGLYHQRCGYANTVPFTRFTKGICHEPNATVPSANDAEVNGVLAGMSADNAGLQGSAPALSSISASLYPFINTGPVATQGGHHDAGDYSKYTIDVCLLSHSLLFAVDAFPGVSNIDNLGVPESGDGIPDVLQEAKWEIDYLSHLQDADGGFYFLVYPANRQYESDVTLVGTNLGDPQVVFPKTTSATAAAVGALAEAGSSPLMKKYYPAQAAQYLTQAQLGWQFLTTAIAKYGRTGCYQAINQYGNSNTNMDELAWAASALFAATGNPVYENDLTNHFDPSNPGTIYWGWWRMFESYGCATRDYAFAARTGRLQQSQLDPAYLAKCETQIVDCGNDNVNWANANAYHNSFSQAYKSPPNAGWFFSVNQDFDLAVANVVSNSQTYIDTMIGNMNYEGGCNPVDMTFVTGIGWKRQHQIVSQYADNAVRALPPTGIPLGSVQTGFVTLSPYGTENGQLVYPPDSQSAASYPLYDRWADTFNTMTELVSPQQGRSLAAMAYLMAQSSPNSAAWNPTSVTATITNLPAVAPDFAPISVGLSVPGVDMSEATYVWEATGQDPTSGAVFNFEANSVGAQWIEVEALLPDGRRIFATNAFYASTATNLPPNSYLSGEYTNITSDIVALYPLDNSWADATGQQAPLAPSGSAYLDTYNISWMANPTGSSLHCMNVGDQATVSIPSSYIWNSGTKRISVESMIYLNAYMGTNVISGTIVSLYHNWDAFMQFYCNPYLGPLFNEDYNDYANSTAPISAALTPGTWHHFSLAIDASGYSVEVDGATVYSLPSGDLANWGNAPGGNTVLTLGNFSGWMDEVVVRNTTSTPVTVTNIVTPVVPVPPVVPVTFSTAAAPVISPASELFTNSTSVALSSSTPGATIYYTTDGTVPTTSSAVYTGSFSIASSTAVNALAALSGMGNSGVATANFTLATATQIAGSLPTPPWANADIGQVGLTGSATYNNGTFTVNGSGADIWGNADALQYVYQPVTGDCQIVAQVAGLQKSDPWSKAGVMIRQSLNPSDANVLTLISAANGSAMQYRATAGQGAINISGGNNAAPYWVKLTRVGNLFTSYTSVDGVNWTSIGSVSFVMTGAVYVGLAVCAHNNSSLCTAIFSSVAVTDSQSGQTSSIATPLPVPWSHQDIGSVGLAGTAGNKNGTMTVTGSGADIWGTADAFQFASQPWTGKGSIIAQVLNVPSTDPWAKAGVMIRSSLTANSAAAAMFISAGSGSAFQYRNSTGAYMTQGAANAYGAPYWIKLSRNGNVLTAYCSPDGVNWTKTGSVTIAMGKTVYFGLAVTSHNNSVLNTSTFTNVKVSANL
ncbi:MAG TPA: glycoside hydrolase family 9 protein [Candidatus Saccharimonadales bacterium]|nr:glycoside hydrolase family 9 protein [Candidatus Saccharimonadales bacterium]